MIREEMQPAWERVVDIGFSNYDQLSRDQKIWFNIEPLTIDGIIDHYINSGADHNKDTLEALIYLGFADISEQMMRINKLFKNGYPPGDIIERNEEWNMWNEDNAALIDEIDDYFWKRCADLESALIKHINLTCIGT